jgi:hypothetical protein
MQYRVNFLVDGLYNIEKKCRVLKSIIYDVHTPKTTKIRQNKQGREFQILITYLNANDPTG